MRGEGEEEEGERRGRRGREQDEGMRWGVRKGTAERRRGRAKCSEPGETRQTRKNEEREREKKPNILIRNERGIKQQRTRRIRELMTIDNNSTPGAINNQTWHEKEQNPVQRTRIIKPAKTSQFMREQNFYKNNLRGLINTQRGKYHKTIQ